MSLEKFPRFDPMQPGDGHVSLSNINVRNVPNTHTIVLVTLVTCLREMRTCPLQEPIVVKENLLFDDVEGHASNGTHACSSAQPKTESTLIITDELQQHDDQPDSAMMLGEYFQPPAVVNLDVSEDLLAAQHNPHKKTLFCYQWESKIALYGPLLILVQVAI